MARRNKKKIYSIILVNHGKQLRTICSEETDTKIYKRFKELLDESKEVNNNHEHVMIEAEYELVIIKCSDEFDNKVNKVRSDSGEFVNYETTDEDWIVVDRSPYNIEETFWVYGYHPRLQRKDFNWVFDNFIAKDSKNKYMFKSVQVFLNKLLVDCNGKLDIVICKNKKDSIRLYNTIEETAREKKFKYVLFMGDITQSKYRSDWVDRIRKLTGWNDIKINRPSTRP